MPTLQSIHTFEELKDWLGSELDGPVEDFDYEDLGGKAGNATLRQHLDWDNARYEAVKQSLLEQGHIRSSRGRGGSVLLP